MPEALHQLDVKAVVHGLREGRFTSEDLTRDCLERIEKLEPKIEAWAWLDHAAALASARAADHARRAGKLGTLQGVPIGVKDIIDVRGVPTRMGSPLFEDYIPSASAQVVRRLDEAGAVVLGKTVTTELAYLGPGKTRNPWNTGHTPGGSSSGSAAAVAARFVPATIGTQTNGSVIRPAAFCGVVGYKPSSGLLPRAGILKFSHTLDQVGVFGRSVEDTAIVCSAMLDRSAEVPDSNPEITQVPRDLVPAPLYQPPRVAAVRTSMWHLVEKDQQENFLQTIAQFRKAGAVVESAVLPDAFSRAHEVHRVIMHYEGARSFGGLQTQNRDRLGAEMNRLIDDGNLISETAYHAALEHRTRLQSELAEFARRYDILITLPARGEAPATLEHTGDPWFCTIWTLCGAPTITIPSGLGTHGMPLGMQLVGAHMQDTRLLQVAQWCSMQLGFRRHPPS